MADEEFEPGSMDIEAQEKAFNGFVRWVTNSVIVIIAVLIYLAIFWI